eukprot:CAMPEP_0114620724 /NCGR_PEP_ID=MMETSP0168-20121206/8871_1 /TAXON_ID=95228 ORGANISM="Vannella sp., Strain DIVA3 517/6/12" /NCGR_SAMPLE_ID=MMETSP0168 /ASSEMBLY_ACC=CAM_ASM_000044 /LENGTH=249 /DNA_ID=CAMNT_0001831921 /DNA_START=7 /DNA_END=757 /DNA_ORIENTATION=-
MPTHPLADAMGKQLAVLITEFTCVLHDLADVFSYTDVLHTFADLAQQGPAAIQWVCRHDYSDPQRSLAFFLVKDNPRNASERECDRTIKSKLQDVRSHVQSHHIPMECVVIVVCTFYGECTIDPWYELAPQILGAYASVVGPWDWKHGEQHRTTKETNEQTLRSLHQLIASRMSLPARAAASVFRRRKLPALHMNENDTIEPAESFNTGLSGAAVYVDTAAAMGSSNTFQLLLPSTHHMQFRKMAGFEG